MSTYEKFAYIYDRMGSDEFSIKMFEYTRRILTRLKYRPRSVLDLACGTGTAAALWAGQNITVFAIDGSEHMLEMAREKAGSENLKIDFSRQSMTSFSLKQRVDLITCYFDSINYLLTPKDLTACFKSVEKTLYPGGLFIFDANTPEAMKTLWDSQTYAEVQDHIAWIWKNVYFPKARRAEVRATFFVRKDDIWERFDELHTERGYTVTELKRTLKKAGLKVIRTYKCLKFTAPARRDLRIAIVAQKAD